MTENQINLFTIQDMYNHVDKNESADIGKVYDPLHFWDDYGDRYYKDHKKPQDFSKHVPFLLNKLKPLNIETLYDAGCGFCRLEPFLLQGEVVKKITAADISQKQLDAAKTYLEVKREGFKTEEEYHARVEMMKNIDIIKQTVKWSKIPADSFDCTLSVECLQHLHLPTVRLAIHQLVKLSKKYIVLIERYLYDEEHPFPHVWSHNYTKLLGDAGVKVLESTFIGNGVIGIIGRK